MNEAKLADKRRKNVERRIRLLESHGLSDPAWAPGLASVTDIVKGCFLLASDLVEEMQEEGVLRIPKRCRERIDPRRNFSWMI